MSTRPNTPAIVLPWPNSHQPLSSRFLSLGLPQRLTLFILLFAIEWIPLTYLVHKEIGAGRVLQLGVVFAALFGAFAYARAKPQLQRISVELERIPFGWAFFVAHIGAYLAFIGVSYLTLWRSPSGEYTLLTAIWILTGVLAIGLNGCAFLPPKFALRLVRNTGYVWVYALAAAVVAWRLARPPPERAVECRGLRVLQEERDVGNAQAAILKQGAREVPSDLIEEVSK